VLYQRPHLPQGAPTSPALANLAADRLDCRLAGLAAACGARYTRYADDLVFSGPQPFARMVQRFYIAVCAIALEEGFEVHTGKTRIMHQSVSQRAAGAVLNQHVNAPRAKYDRLSGADKGAAWPDNVHGRNMGRHTKVR
jgi:RNA-directed DNA polymerase